MTSILEVEQLDTLSSNASSTLTIGGTNTTTIAFGPNVTTTPSSLANTPSFFVVRSGTQSGLSADTATKVQWNSEVWDTDSAFDSTTNYRFTVPSGKAGKYSFTASIYTGNLQADNRYAINYFYKNGSETYGTAYWYTSGSNNAFPRSNVILDLSDGDYIEVYSRQQAGELTVQASTMTFFTGFKLV